MRIETVLTLTGPDRVGIVEDVTRILLELGGNVGTSRMSRLGGEFAVLMLVSLPDEAIARADAAFESLREAGYVFTLGEAHAASDVREGWEPYRVEVHGADHEGIVHGIAKGLSARGITIESAETRTEPAPTSGTPVFVMTAHVLVPPSLAGTEWIADLDEAARLAGVDVEVEAGE